MNSKIRALGRRVLAAFVSLCLLINPVVSSYRGVSAAWAFLFPVAAVLSSAPLPALAGDFENAAALGNATGRLELPKARPGVSDPATGTITLKNANASVNNTTFNLTQLFQGSGVPANGASAGSASGTYGSTSAMQTEATAQEGALLDPTNGTAWSNAYKTFRGSALGRGHPDLTNDPVAVQARAIANGTDPNAFINGMAASCVTVTNPNNGTTTTHLPDIRMCDRYAGPSGCRVTRRISAVSTVPKQILHYEGVVKDNNAIKIQMRTPTPVSLSVTGYAGDITNAVAAAGGYYWERNSDFSGDWIATLNLDTFTEAELPESTAPHQFFGYSQVVTDSGTAIPTFDFPTRENGYVLTIDFNGRFAGNQYANVTIVATGSIVSEDVPWDEPSGCSSPSASCTANPTGWVSGGTMLDNASTNAWECINGDDSRFFGAVNLDATYWPRLYSLYPGEPQGTAPICYQAVARNFSCSGPGIPNDTCGPILADPKCVFVSSACPPENRDETTGVCTFWTDTYDCGTDVVTGTPTSTTTTSCGGPVRCMGTDCATPMDRETNPDFERAAMALQVAQYAQNDKDCNGVECGIFKGEAYTCKIAFYGVSNCCDLPSGVSIADYIKIIWYTYKVTDTSAIADMMVSNGLDGVVGAWGELSNAASATYDTLTQPVISAWESVMGETTSTLTDAASAAVDSFKQELSRQLNQWLIDNGYSELASSMFTDLGGGVLANNWGAAAGEALQFMATAFMYYQIFVIAVNIIYSCDSKEVELATKKEMRSCHYLGDFCAQKVLGVCIEKKRSYCCFKSPFARIIQEQVRHQYSRPWPAASATPNCPALSIADLQNVDWALVDLSEWLALLKTADIMPGSAAAADTLYQSDRITKFVQPDGGHGSSVTNNGTQALASPATPSAANEQVRASLWGTLP